MNELLYKMDARFIKLDDIGHVPEGERKNFHYMGDISGDAFSGQVRGIDYTLTVDGTINVHIHEVLTTAEGERIYIERTGASYPSDDPDLVLLEGEGQMRTAAERLAWLNDTPVRWRGRMSTKTVAFLVEVFKHEQ